MLESMFFFILLSHEKKNISVRVNKKLSSKFKKEKKSIQVQQSVYFKRSFRIIYTLMYDVTVNQFW